MKGLAGLRGTLESASRWRAPLVRAFERHPLAKVVAILVGVGYALVLVIIGPFAVLALEADVVAIAVLVVLWFLMVVWTLFVHPKNPILPRGLSYASPDPEAVEFAQLDGHGDLLIVAGNIELAAHPELNSGQPVESLGWDPNRVALTESHLQFDARAVTRAIPRARRGHPAGENGVKFAVSSYGIVTTDSKESLSLSLSRTDYYTVVTVLEAIEAQAGLRRKYGSLDPERNLIPHTLCLHVILRFRDGELLGMVRDPRLPWAPSTFSVSFEEQLTESDLLETSKPATRWFRRALLEEVFGLRENTDIAKRWARISHQVESTRIWALFVEQERLNYSLLGVCQLSINADELARSVLQRINRSGGSLDREGAYYRVPRDSAGELLQGRATMIQPLYGGPAKRLTVDELHPTSTYRLFRLLHAVQEKPFG